MNSLPLGTKVCPRCGKDTPLTEFSRRNDTASGYVSHCKACVREYGRRHYKEAAATPKIVTPAKFCTACERAKPVSEFAPRKDHPTGYHAHCHACRRAYYAANSEKLLQKKAGDYGRHTAARKAYKKAYIAANPDKAKLWRVKTKGREKYRADARAYSQRKRTENPDEHLARTHAYRVANRDKFNAKTKRYYDRKKANGGNFTADEWAALKARYGQRCLCCGTVPRLLTPDHIVPVSKGGSNDIANIQPLCKPCNSRKSTRTIDYRPT